MVTTLIRVGDPGNREIHLKKLKKLMNLSSEVMVPAFETGERGVGVRNRILMVLAAGVIGSLAFGFRWDARLEKPASVQVPGVPKASFVTDAQGVKEFRLIAQALKKFFYKGFNGGKSITVWGFNGSMPGPTIEVTEGDRIRVIVRNELPEATTIHWHGIELPNEMDGAGEHTQVPIAPGTEFIYEYTLQQSGTYMYHSGLNQTHQIGMGLAGFLIVHPKKPEGPPVDVDYAFILQMWKVAPGGQVPDTTSMEEQYMTMNGLSSPAIPHLHAKVGQRVRIRLANLSIMVHPIHLHGHRFAVTGTDGGRIPDSAQWLASTVTVGAGETRDVEFAARAPGHWMFHCHFLHHIMSDMMKPVIPGEPMNMELGGMHSVLEVMP